jgi:hypothetical protein
MHSQPAVHRLIPSCLKSIIPSQGNHTHSLSPATPMLGEVDAVVAQLDAAERNTMPVKGSEVAGQGGSRGVGNGREGGGRNHIHRIYTHSLSITSLFFLDCSASTLTSGSSFLLR